MSKLLVVYYSMYGHVETLAKAVAGGASTVAGSDGSRQPSENELQIARYQGQHVAEITARLVKDSLK